MYNKTNPSPLIAIVGPTASGKTSRGVSLARLLDGEIVSADSRQIYRGMDLGTGKDIDEYGDVPYHLIDIRPAGYKYNLYEYIRDARNAIDDITRRKRIPIVVGGTGLYVETLLRDKPLPEVPRNDQLRSRLAGMTLNELTQILSGMKTLHNSTDIDTPARAMRAIEIQTYYEENPDSAPRFDVENTAKNYKPYIFVVDIDREARRSRITQRLHERLKAGMVDEVRRLIDSGVAPNDLIYYGLEYKYLTQYVIGNTNYDTMVCELEIAIHQFAKRQATWFRGMERRGFTLYHLPYNLSDSEFNKRIIDITNTQ